MAAHIPFANTPSDSRILRNLYSDSQIVRVSLESIDNIKEMLPGNTSLWIDPSIDAYHHRLVTNWPEDRPFSKWSTFQKKLWNNLEDLFGKYDNYKILAEEAKWTKSNYNPLKEFVCGVLDKCCEYSPCWLSIPQLPLVDGAKRNKINKMLCEATREWKSKNQNKVKLILPVILTNQRQLHSKPTRDKKLKIIKDSYDLAGANGLWITDESLTDQNRNEKYPARYSKLVEFHKKIRDTFPKGTTIIAGPYWGLNLVLWAKQLCDYPAISLGSGYTYNISCGVPSSPNVRIAIPPIRRMVVVSGELKKWLSKAIKKLSPTDPSYQELERILDNFNMLSTYEAAKKQVARFYKGWFDELEIVPEIGRTVGLYQDLSSAYVLGKQFQKLPEPTLPRCPKAIRDAGKVAEQLMMQIL